MNEMKITNVDINLDSLLSSIFGKQKISFYKWTILSSFLCSEMCPLPHINIYIIALTYSKQTSSVYTIRMVGVDCEINLHDERFYSCNENDSVSSHSSFFILDTVVLKEWKRRSSLPTRDLLNCVESELKRTERIMKKHLCENDIGRGFAYSSLNSNPLYIMNVNSGDLIVA